MLVEGTSIAIVAVTFVSAVLVLTLIWYFANKSHESSENEDKTKSDDPSHDLQQQKGKDKKHKKDRGRENGVKQPDTAHPWLLTTLKGHPGRILSFDFSPNGKNLASCDENRTVLVWNVKDFHEKEHKSTRGNLPFDHATKIKFAPDSKSIVMNLGIANRLAIYKLAKKESGAVGYRLQEVETDPFSSQKEGDDITSIGVSCNGKFIMTSSGSSFAVWSLKGDLLKRLNTIQSTIYQASISSCGRYIITSGFTPDVKVFQVQFSRQGDFQDVVRAFDLKGHNSGVFAFDCNQDSTKMITASKDTHFKLWDTDIRFGQGQEPYLIATGEWDALKEADPNEVLVALSPDGDSFALSVGKILRVFQWPLDTKKQKVEFQFEEIESYSSLPTTYLQFSTDSEYLAASMDKHIRIFYNVTGYKAKISRFEGELRKKQDSEAHKRRLEAQIEIFREKLKSIE